MVMGRAMRTLAMVVAVGALGACGRPAAGITAAVADAGFATLRHGGGHHGGHGGGHHGGWGRHGGWGHDGGWGRHGGWHRGAGWHGGYGWRGNYGWAGWNSWYPGLDYGYSYGYVPWVVPDAVCNPLSPWYPQCAIPY